GGYSVRFSPTKGAVYVKDINFKNVVEFKCDGQRCSPTGKVCNSRYTICDEPSSKNKKKLPGPFDQSLNTVRGHKVVSPSNNDADMQAARINSPPKVPEGQELYERKSGYRPTRTFYFLCDKEGTCNSYNDPCTCEIMEGYLSTDKNGKTTSHSDSARDIGKILDLPYVGPKSDFLSDTFVVLSKSRNYAIATLKACCPKPPATTC
ncbi:MAG: hypothetical protein Q8O89_08495, partial [Nanoarchaeota archaeon]|nr:hypothetical protein [Nanoarchaeota archaeon]